jgi:hypothetical protein
MSNKRPFVGRPIKPLQCAAFTEKLFPYGAIILPLTDGVDRYDHKADLYKALMSALVSRS